MLLALLESLDKTLDGTDLITLGLELSNLKTLLLCLSYDDSVHLVSLNPVTKVVREQLLHVPPDSGFA